VLLRLAVLLNRGRSTSAQPKIDLRVKGRSIELAFSRGWIEDHPLTAADLEQEIEALKVAGFRAKIAEQAR